MTSQDDKTAEFRQILQSEHAAINQRRLSNARAGIQQCSTDSPGIGWPVYDTVGLALSGGGIRSAAISLGILQALNDYGVLSRIDYLSTVSGGGFTGSSLTTTLTFTQGQFVFSEKYPEPPIQADAASKAVEQLRNHSNYLMPAGKGNFGQAVAIIVRGLVANSVILMSVLLLLAAATIALHQMSVDQ
jgi:hypothetical protein